MIESKDIQAIFNQVAIQVVTTVVMVLKEANAGSRSGTYTASLREVHRQKHSRPAPKQPLFN